MRWRTLLSALAAAAATSLARPAAADSVFVLNITDAAGSGFNDPTPATPTGGNPGTTLGAQRKIAFQYAADTWGKLLDSPVPIVIEASFGSLDCASSVVVAGQATPSGLLSDIPGLPPGQLFPEALADRILETDIDPGQPDIIAQFNAEIKACLGIDWYYGLDAKPARTESDLVYVVLHELTHGLGFLTTSDPTTGQMLQAGMSDPFTAHMLDDSTQQHWPDMTDSGRMQSARNVRNLSWDGKAVSAAATKVLSKGAPSLKVKPAPPGFGGAVSEGNFGLLASLGPVTAGLAMAALDAQCSSLTGSVRGKIALVTSADSCNPLDFVYAVQAAGGVGLLLASNLPNNPPRSLSVPNADLGQVPVDIPTLGISAADAALLQGGTGLSVTLASDGSRLDGTDTAGRVYLYTSNPIDGASTGSHWDPLVRPDLVLEPIASRNPSHDMTMELALLRDIGWAPFCGNARLDPKEECDSGAANSDTNPNACRTTCTNPKCGDGVTDDREACDDGPTNSDTLADACRTACTKARCGDSVIDTGEKCDHGLSNSDTQADACRTTCTKAKCGDGVVDAGEQCDQGPANDDTQADACRTTCTKAKCGDGVVDTGEQCDQGPANTASDACHADCVTSSSSTGGAPTAGSGSAGSGDAAAAGSKEGSGCGCRVGARAPVAGGLGYLLAAGPPLLLWRRRARRTGGLNREGN
jgi:hypothetical protein